MIMYKPFIILKGGHFILDWGYKTISITINTDINECDGANDCNSKLGVCSNNAGGYSCSCKTGYSGDGRTCAGRYHCF